jgi:hypothetical protein
MKAGPETIRRNSRFGRSAPGEALVRIEDVGHEEVGKVEGGHLRVALEKELEAVQADVERFGDQKIWGQC